MLAVREIKLLNLLRDSDYSGESLAKELNVSRRTIIRTIARLNEQLTSLAIGKIITTPNYNLVVDDNNQLMALLEQGRDEQNLIILLLAMHGSLPLAEIMDTLFLSRNTVLEYVEQINQEYQTLFVITAQPRIGLELQPQRLTLTDLVANFIYEYPHLLAKLPPVSSQAEIELLGTTIINPYTKWITPEQWQKQLLAVLLTKQPYQTGPTYPMPHELPLTSHQAQQLAYFIGQRITNLQLILQAKADIINSTMQLAVAFQLVDLPSTTYEAIFDHLCREVAFPRPTITLSPLEIREIKGQNPIAFEFANTLIADLMVQFPMQWWDAQFLALYIVQAIAQHANVPIKILFLSQRPSLTRINTSILEQQLPQIELKIAYSLADFKNLLVKETFDLKVLNAQRTLSVETRTIFDYTFQTIITEHDLQMLSKLISGKHYYKHLPDFMPQDNFITIDNDPNDDYFMVLADGLEHFVTANQLSPYDCHELINRELAGNQLLLQHVAIPHIMAKHVQEYQIFGIKLTHPVQLADQTVTLILAVLVGSSQTTKTNLFSYLYQTLQQVSLPTIDTAMDYQKLIKLLTATNPSSTQVATSTTINA
ncbi:HTH domain-containing protein [Periweissella fabaria]|uniref:PTS EIIA type-2 domain-containing protein n=1 Tax=Periweissella fabaria TaxID=546157 RepID=A0ABM8Z4Y5_9LACO|nr:HTH domain-containing protein [Periweissella fabaria]MCM0598044.1 HTH domain-containing protein [Periweissella fabaria]CAH0415893.1 hypothetical protein WFA24289_00191 [Periweissella fabaria]